MTVFELMKHKPGAAACPMKPIPCDACGVAILRSEFVAHEGSAGHHANVVRRCEELLEGTKTLSASLASAHTLLREQHTAMEAMKGQFRTMAREVDEKFSSADARMDQKIGELRSHVSAEFCEFEISKWSEVKEAALFSTATPLRAWNHEWYLFPTSFVRFVIFWCDVVDGRWLKVEKATDRIGLYLCCGEDGRFPVSVDYQLMCRRRGNDDGVCSSVVFRTVCCIALFLGCLLTVVIAQDFGKEKVNPGVGPLSLTSFVGMGFIEIYNYGTTGKGRSVQVKQRIQPLTRPDGFFCLCSRGEDKIAFGISLVTLLVVSLLNREVLLGCIIFPIRNCFWGRQPRRTVAPAT